MNNIKSVVVLKPVYGLHVDAVLSRENASDNFSYKSEYAGSDHSHKHVVEISESLLDKEYFSAIEWFEPKPLTNKEKIKMLTEERDLLGKEVVELEERLQMSDETYYELVSKIKKEIDRFESLYKEYEAVAEADIYSNGIDIDLTVFKNILNVLKGLK